MLFHIDVFRFNSNTDYNEYYQSLKLDVNDSLHLSDLLDGITARIDDFTYDPKLFGFRINDVVIFKNLKLLNIIEEFGDRLVFTPISIKYAMKDLLVDTESLFNRYRPILDKFSFLSHEFKLEFKKYLLLNLVSPLDFDDYIGDGYCLYVKKMMIHYKGHMDELLDSISRYDNGVMNSIDIGHMIYPYDLSIDRDIEGLKRLLLNRQGGMFKRYHWGKISKVLENQYKKISK